MHEEAVRELANARQAIVERAADVAEAEARIARAFPEYCTIRQALAEAKQHAETLEETLRTVILNRLQFFGEEPDHAALGIRTYTELEYDEISAIIEAVDHRLYGLVNLDKKRFEKVVPVLWPSMVRVGKRVVATIARDLSEWAGEPEGEAEPT